MPPTNPTTDQPESTLLEPPGSSAEDSAAEAPSAEPSTSAAAETSEPRCPPGCTHSRLSDGAGELARPAGAPNASDTEAAPASAQPTEEARGVTIAWPDELPQDGDTRRLTLALISQTARRVAQFVDIQPEHPNAPGLLQGLAGIYQALHGAQQASTTREAFANVITEMARQSEAGRAEILRVLEKSQAESARSFGPGPFRAPPASPGHPADSTR